MNIEKKKIAMLIRTLKGGGAEKVFVNLANHFVKRGHDVYLITTSNGDYFNLLSSEINLILLPEYKTAGWGKLNTLIAFVTFFIRSYKTIIELRPQFLFCTLDISNIVGSLIKRFSFLKFKLIIRQANVVSQDNPSNIMNRLLRSSFKSSDLLIANSIDTKESLKNNMGSDGLNIKTISNPIFSQGIVGQSKQHIEFEFLSEKKYILNVGSLTEQKDQRTLLNAFQLVCQKRQDVNLLILGKGALENELKELAKKLKIDQFVSFLGFVKNPYPYYAKSDIFVLSSIYEGFGNVIIEALSFGTKVICTDCPGGPNFILDNGKYGDLVPVRNTIALSEAMLYRLNNLDEFDSKSLIYRAHDFSVDKIGDLYLQIFSEI